MSTKRSDSAWAAWHFCWFWACSCWQWMTRRRRRSRSSCSRGGPALRPSCEARHRPSGLEGPTVTARSPGAEWATLPETRIKEGAGAQTATPTTSKSCLNRMGVFSHSVVPDSLRPPGLWATRLLCPGILQARVPEWAAMTSSRGSSRPRDQICVSGVGRRFLTTNATWEAVLIKTCSPKA